MPLGKVAVTGDGLDVQKVEKAILQLQGLKLMGPFTSGGSLVAGVKATATQSDGTGSTLIWSARIAGEHGNFIFIDTKRRTAFGDGAVFDVDVYATKTGQGVGTTFTVPDHTNDKCHAVAHGMATGDAVRVTTQTTLPTNLTAGVCYFVVKVNADDFKLATTRANATAATPVVIDIGSAGTGTHKFWKLDRERYAGCSMKDDHPRYVERMVNGVSEWVTVADQDETNAEDRPADTTSTPLACTSGAGENALTGLVRGDVIVGGYVSDAAGVAQIPVTAEASDDGKFVLTGSQGIANGHLAVLLVLPKTT